MQSNKEKKDKESSMENLVNIKKDSSKNNMQKQPETTRERERTRETSKSPDRNESKDKKNININKKESLKQITNTPTPAFDPKEKHSKKIFCWGFGKYGQIGTTKFQYSPDPLELSHSENDGEKSIENPNLTNTAYSNEKSGSKNQNNLEELKIENSEIEQISSGEFHTAILTKDNRIYTWGKNSFGQLGNESNEITCFPRLVDFFFKKQSIIITKIALGGEHSLALSNNNELFSWGLNIFGQLGLNNTANLGVPKRVEKIRNFVRNEETKVVEKEVIKRMSENEKILEIAAGAQHSLILTSNNHLYSCGFSKNMSLGYFTKDEDPLESMIFTRIHAYSSTKKFSKITCGVNHSGCVFGNAEILFWGKGEYLSYENPTVINFNKYPISQITDFKIGENFYIIKNSNGELFSCGNNDYGQLGIGGNNNSPKKHIEKVWLSEKVKSFDCGYNYVISITESNKIFGWGYNKTGQILDIMNEKINLPKELSVFQEMGIFPLNISCGGYHATLYSALPSSPSAIEKIEKIRSNIEHEKYKFYINKSFEPDMLEKEQSLIENLNLKHNTIKEQIKEKEKEIEIINKRIEDKKQRMSLLPQRGKRKNEKSVQDRKMQFDEEIKMEDLSFFKDSDIGTGTFGDVKKCNWRKTLVAVKFLKKVMENEKENIHSFIEELNLLKKLRHPNILLYLGANITGPNFFLVTEFCDLGNLFDFLHNNPRSELAEADRIRIALEIGKGVNYLHSFDTPILHRDLKSLNILLDKNMTVKIADFGWARLRDIHMTKQRGTFQWMAPEVIKKNSYTEKADIFSFGIILWELWVQEPPYKNIDRFEVAKSVATIKNYRPPLVDVIPESIKALISACWDYNPDNRPTFEMIIDFIERLNIE
jgi:mitogen-activated protein kinase kinase kinase 9